MRILSFFAVFFAIAIPAIILGNTWILAAVPVAAMAWAIAYKRIFKKR